MQSAVEITININIGLEALRKQREWLLQQPISPEVEGLINLTDYIADRLADDGHTEQLVMDSVELAEQQRQIEKFSPPPMYLNHYECPCGTTWKMEDECTCDDRCPSCNTSCSPTDSEDV